ncbi:MAG: hypothetical protein GF353_04380 [Candidatus Lokiarchaeota archaeon]|nr:hypothetical protein [Candidatus Lokiarchaeota archaeon]
MAINISKIQIYFIGLAALVLSAIQQAVYLLFGTLIVYFGFIADIVIIVCAFLIRFSYVSFEKYSELILETDEITSVSKKHLKPSRFLNGMVIAIIIGTFASIVIHYFSLIGILIYLIMQLIHIWSFNGIIHYKLKFIYGRKAKSIRYPALISTVCFLIICPLLFFILILPEWKSLAIIVLPYIFVLILMTIITYFGLGYTKRPLKFRIMLCIGASLFLFSDLMIGSTAFSQGFYLAPLLIYPTWITAMFLMQLSILELKKNKF